MDARSRGEVLPTLRELGIGFVAYSPHGRGFLTGRFRRFEDLPDDDYRRNSPRFQGENFQKNLDLVRHIEQLARRKGCTPSQLALAWLLARGKDIVPIPGTKAPGLPRGECRSARGESQPRISARSMRSLLATSPPDYAIRKPGCGA